MSEPKYTPAPWATDPDDPRDVRASDGELLATAYPMQNEDDVSEEDHPVAEANARLIAAAPDLLAACRVVKEFLDSLEAATDSADRLAAIRREVHAPLRAALEPAIAKAERHPNCSCGTGARGACIVHSPRE
jgi:hypothetical protein